jgi:hypothetical protein
MSRYNMTHAMRSTFLESNSLIHCLKFLPSGKSVQSRRTPVTYVVIKIHF